MVLLRSLRVRVVCNGDQMKQTRRDKYLQKKYGITEAVFLKMLALFDGNCWICKKKPKKSVLNVDHDHKTGQVRGLLCFSVTST